MDEGNHHFRFLLRYILLVLVIRTILQYFGLPNLSDDFSLAVTVCCSLVFPLAIFYPLLANPKKERGEE